MADDDAEGSSINFVCGSVHATRAREDEYKIWRYQHFDSNTHILQKRATLTACLKKTQKHARGKPDLVRAALAKIAEFRRLGYPIKMLSDACTFLGASTSCGTWIGIREILRHNPCNGPKAGSGSPPLEIGMGQRNPG